MPRFSSLSLLSSGLLGCLAVPITAAPVSHYALNEGGGTAADSVGGVHMTPRTQTAELFGLTYGVSSVPAGTYGAVTVTSAKATAFGTAVQGAGFANDSQFVNTTASNALNTLTGDRTVAAWVKPDSLSSLGRILASGPLVIGTSRTGWGMGVLTTGMLRFTTYGRKDFDQTAGLNITTGSWSHVASTYTQDSSTSSTVRHYINGQLVATVTGLPTDAANPNATFGLFGAGNGTEAFAGTIDDVWVFNTALSSSEIITVASGNPIPEPSTAAAVLGFAMTGLLMRRRRANARA